MDKYWVGEDSGCPISGPFDLWRKNYFLEYGTPPDDTRKMFPALSKGTITGIATATIKNSLTLEEVMCEFAEGGNPKEQLTMAYTYFYEWRKHAPFLPDAFQDIPLRPARTSPEPLDEFLADFRK